MYGFWSKCYFLKRIYAVGLLGHSLWLVNWVDDSWIFSILDCLSLEFDLVQQVVLLCKGNRWSTEIMKWTSNHAWGRLRLVVVCTKMKCLRLSTSLITSNGAYIYEQLAFSFHPTPMMNWCLFYSSSWSRGLLIIICFSCWGLWSYLASKSSEYDWSRDLFLVVVCETLL